jgi:hypothetical protein
MTSPASFDLHGRVAIRLVDARPADAAVVARQLGPLAGQLDREADLTLRFVDRLPADGVVRFLGHEEAAYTDREYLVLRGRHKSSVRVAIPLDRVGVEPCEVVCERGLPAVPLLVALVNLVALGRGLVPVHACAFVHGEVGTLVLGWAKGGKSETLLAFTARGDRYVGDEWIYLDPAIGRMVGLPEPMRVWDWQLRAMPDLAARVPAGARRRLAVTRAGVGALRTFGSIPIAGRRSPGRLAARVRALLEGQLSVQVPTDRLLGTPPLADGWTLDRLILVTSHESDAVTVDGVDPLDVARRATASVVYEAADLLAHYRRFRFAFPERRNPLLEALESRYESVLSAAFSGLPALAVGHPYPLDIPRLYDAIAPRLT